MCNRSADEDEQDSNEKNRLRLPLNEIATLSSISHSQPHALSERMCGIWPIEITWGSRLNWVTKKIKKQKEETYMILATSHMSASLRKKKKEKKKEKKRQS